ncbi:hypothetical protein DL98DRAFT_597692 [Cadophora sp. DSE1049]|nr:hypothetical protein DL98DRAFT_597692 [Cadophora sp. DSE1049]
MSDTDPELTSSSEKHRPRDGEKKSQATDGTQGDTSSEEEAEHYGSKKRPTESPQAIIDKFWTRQASEHPGKVKNEYDSERVSSEEEYRQLYQRNSGALYFGWCQNPNQIWLLLLEKAFAKDYVSLAGGHTGEAIEDLTGGVTDAFSTSDILDKDYFWSQLLEANE